MKQNDCGHEMVNPQEIAEYNCALLRSLPCPLYIQSNGAWSVAPRGTTATKDVRESEPLVMLQPEIFFNESSAPKNEKEGKKDFEGSYKSREHFAWIYLFHKTKKSILRRTEAECSKRHSKRVAPISPSKLIERLLLSGDENLGVCSAKSVPSSALKGPSPKAKVAD